MKLTYGEKSYVLGSGEGAFSEVTICESPTAANTIKHNNIKHNSNELELESPNWYNKNPLYFCS